ncbi:MAG: T9SS type A sorting domain-containing protein [Aequorivita sp.]|nr:T9SS type A sorting domain-containing protein [Aequorivita sp.]
MKKITFFTFTLFATGLSFAQTTFAGSVSSSPTVISQEILAKDACSQEVLTNNLENGGLFGGATNQSLAIDIDVPANSTFLVEELIPTFVGDATSTQFVFLANDGGIPGSELATSTATETDNVITGNNFGFDFHQITYTVDTPYLIEGGATGTKIWVQIINDADGWESSTVSSTGEQGAFKNDNSGQVWTIGTSDYVYQVNGQCDILGLGQNVADLVSIYPNPTSGILNLKMPASIEVKSAVIFDILGKKSNVVYSNGTMNISSLSQGIYLLKVETTVGTLTQKIVKQ